MYRIKLLSRQTRLLVTTAGLALVVILGGLDYATGPEISVSIFYLLPISWVTWLTNRRGGIILAIISAIAWLISDLTTQKTHSHFLIPYWNAIVRLLFFLTIVYLESNIRNLNQNLEDRIKDRTALLEAEIAEREKIQEKLKQYAKRLEILHEIDQEILAADSLDTVVQATILHVQKLPPCDRASFMLIDFEGHQTTVFEISEKSKYPNSFKQHIPVNNLPDFFAKLESLRQGGVRFINDLFSSPLESSIMQTFQLEGYGSLMTVPILVQDELIGCLTLMSQKCNAFSSQHLDVGQEIASQLGIAIKQSRMIEQLRKDQENLQTLSRQLLGVQEAERREIARELHDEIGQVLTGVGLTLEMAAQFRTDLGAEDLRQAHALVVELMERVSRLSLELRPALLDDLGLLPALIWFLDRYLSQTNVRVIFKHSGLDNRRFVPEIETAAYRIVQESLTNVARHAKAKEAKLALWFDQGVLGIQIEDEGIGFNHDAVLSAGYASGILGMRERVSLLSGKLTIESGEGLGTRLQAEIPVDALISKGMD